MVLGTDGAGRETGEPTEASFRVFSRRQPTEGPREALCFHQIPPRSRAGPCVTAPTEAPQFCSGQTCTVSSPLLSAPKAATNRDVCGGSTALVPRATQTCPARERATATHPQLTPTTAPPGEMGTEAGDTYAWKTRR